MRESLYPCFHDLARNGPKRPETESVLLKPRGFFLNPALPLILAATLAITLAPRPAAALTADEVRHLLGRVAFGATPGDFKTFAPMSRLDAVNHLLGGARKTAMTPPPAWATESAPMFQRRRSKEDRKAFRMKRRARSRDLKIWWLREMLNTPTPITERMTLFWHNHFTSSLRKVKSPRLLLRQNHLLRRHGLGNFASLLKEIARDPAMVVYLDSRRNKLGRPNENFARELLELFTLGEGHYTEQDVKEAARAFTGWSINRQTGGFRFRARVHDQGHKRFLGQSGAFGGDDILRILLAHPRTAQHVVAKVWRTFVSDRADPRAARRLAADFRLSGYDIRALMAAMLTSKAFWAPENRGRLVKAPSDLVVGTLRFFDVRPVEPFQAARVLRALGQDLFDPPNVKGWPGGIAWITSNRLLRRTQFLRAVMSGRRIVARREATAVAASRAIAADAGTRTRTTPMGMQGDVRRMDMTGPAGTAAMGLGAHLQSAVVPLPPVQGESRGDSPADRLRHLILDPVYQLK
jgi:uncharacterized protein (DUF1800 family)